MEGLGLHDIRKRNLTFEYCKKKSIVYTEKDNPGKKKAIEKIKDYHKRCIVCGKNNFKKPRKTREILNGRGGLLEKFLHCSEKCRRVSKIKLT